MPRSNSPDISLKRVKDLFDYDPLSGLLMWKVRKSNCVRPGDVIRTIRNDGYVFVRFDGLAFAAHRLIFFYMTGRWPIDEIDHINGNRADNSWANLREATQKINRQNLRKPTKKNKTGFLGVYKRGKRFAATIGLNNRDNYLGAFATAEEAYAAYVKAKRALHAGCTL